MLVHQTHEEKRAQLSLILLHLCFGILREQCLMHRQEEYIFMDKSISGAGGSAWSLPGFFLENKDKPCIEDGK